MRITIDRENCIGCGLCEAICPDVFELADDGKSSIKEPYRLGDPSEGEVDESLEDCVRDASESCPVSVISIT